MATIESTPDQSAFFDDEYEISHAVEIAFERRRVDENITPPHILPAAIIAAQMWLACYVVKTLTWSR